MLKTRKAESFKGIPFHHFPLGACPACGRLGNCWIQSPCFCSLNPAPPLGFWVWVFGFCLYGLVCLEILLFCF